VTSASLRPRSRPTIVLRMETWDVLRARRNVRRYADRPIQNEDLDRILEAARRTPSSMNEQPWDFVVVTDPKRLRELAEIWRYSAHVGDSAATIALVMPATEPGEDRDLIQYDLGQATMSIMLAAADLGIGSGHASVGDQEKARRILGLPDDRECPVLVALGYPADGALRPIHQPKRRPLHDVVHMEAW
jgi:nitroreductase